MRTNALLALFTAFALGCGAPVVPQAGEQEFLPRPKKKHAPTVDDNTQEVGPRPDFEWPAWYDPDAPIPADIGRECPVNAEQPVFQEQLEPPEYLTRPQVVAVLDQISSRLHECNCMSYALTITFMFTIRSDGSVKVVQPIGHWKKAKFAWCATQLFCDVKFPRFSKESLTLKVRLNMQVRAQ